MKIINLKFKNINSLAGEWEIDFTRREFTESGLFAITGKTGSGKSSVLDAVSLALYGKTPRVDISGTNNDVMTHGASDCYAEIVFETNGKQWKATWKQERTRNGRLKQVERSIADRNNTIIADRASETGRKTVEILGLTFEQFTKVILLAQGSFAAFLQADKADKGELLEQITGTDIYGEISRQVFERNRTEMQKLETITAQLAAIKILSDEETEILQTEIKNFEEQKKLFDADLQAVDNARKWLNDLSDLQRQIAGMQTALPELAENEKSAKTAFEKAEADLKTAKAGYEKSAPLFVEIRTLDTQIAEKVKVLNSVLAAIDALQNSKSDVERMIKVQKDNLQTETEKLRQAQDWTAKNAKYKSLVEHFAAIEKQNGQAGILMNEMNLKNVELEKAKRDLLAKTEAFNSSKTDFEGKTKQVQKKTGELETVKAELSKLLNGKEIAYYQTEKENITKFGINIKNLIEVEKQFVGNKREIEKCNGTILSSAEKEKELNTAIVENREKSQTLEKQIRLLDENINLAKTVRNLKEHRHALEDGKPCPCCGSTDHPYAKGNIPQIGENEIELKRQNAELQNISNRIQQYEKDLAKCIADRENALNNKIKEENALSENIGKRKTLILEIKESNPDFEVSEDIAVLEHIHAQKQKEYREIDNLLSKSENCNKALKKLRDEEIPKFQKAQTDAETVKNTNETSLKLAEQYVKTQNELAKTAMENYETANRELQKIFAEYGVPNIKVLKKCRDDWNAYKKQTEDLTEKTGIINGDILLKENDLLNVEKSFSEKQAEKQKLEDERQNLFIRRTELFGDKKVDNEEARLKKAMEKAEKTKNTAAENHEKSATKIAETKAVIDETQKRLHEKAAEKITGKTPEQLQSEYEEKKTLADEFSQKIGANRQALQANEQNLKQNRQKLAEREKQQRISERWKNLNDLTGSSDGRKYRNYAQALTFENLIALANRQLQKMSDRYILKRTGDATNPFELAVIDKFQNCDERTAQNLSGGEKFIVSLSLALGLANMASRNMRIDTMFIDEGFGTLDSDYLDVALTALSNLQNEGKLIGIISHLSELKERIGTHIEVQPQGNGHSKIEILC